MTSNTSPKNLELSIQIYYLSLWTKQEETAKFLFIKYQVKQNRSFWVFETPLPIQWAVYEFFLLWLEITDKTDRSG